MRRLIYIFWFFLLPIMSFTPLWGVKSQIMIAQEEARGTRSAGQAEKTRGGMYGKEYLKQTPAPDEEAAAKARQEKLEKGGQLLMQNPERPSMISQAIALSLLSMSPFIVMILSSFLKIVIVLSLLRTALGVAQSPPNQIINGVALMLSLYVMYPTAIAMYRAAEQEMANANTPDSLFTVDSPQYIIGIAKAAREPLREFLQRNSSAAHQALFYRMAYRLLPEDQHEELKVNDFMIVVPAFITSQLKDAFEIGVLIYIPFFVIDLVTSNILLAMGMMMLSPVTISMPLKLFLLVMLDGWTLLIEGLVLTFR